MPQRTHEVLGVSRVDLESRGVFNGFVDLDSRFHLDPHLLGSTSVPEMQGTYDQFTKHFEEVIHLLNASRAKGDRFFREAASRLRFPEIHQVALGYAKAGTRGSGIGPKLAARLADTSWEIVKAGITDPVLFELVGVLEEGFGADRISDMAAHIIMPSLLAFSQRVAGEISSATSRVSFRGEDFQVPIDPLRRQLLVLIPREILRTLPVAHDWSDIDYVCAHNAAVRRRVNGLIGTTWRFATRRISKRELRSVLLRNPEALRDLIEQYKKKPTHPYDFERDPDGELIWHEIAQEFAHEFPLTVRVAPSSPDELLQLVVQVAEHFAELVEANGLFKVFYNDKRELRHERFAQLLFFGIADAYCAANNLDLSRESDAGRGPVDFKVSHGYQARITVEVKYSSNSQLVHGFEQQLPIYNRAERTEYSVYLVIRTTESATSIERVLRLRKNALALGERAPEVVVADGRYRRSASKA